MSLRPFTRIYSGFCLLILIAMTAALLPTQHIARAEQKVVLSKRNLANALIDGKWTVIYSRAQRVEELIKYQMVLFAGSTDPSHPKYPTDAQLTELQQLYLKRLGPGSINPDYRDALPIDVVARTMFDVASTLPAFKSVVAPTLRALSYEDLIRGGANQEEIAEIVKGVRAYSLDGKILKRQHTVIKASVEMAEQDPQFAAFFDKTIGQLFGVSLKDFNTTTYVAAHPELPAQVRSGIRPDGALEISLADLKQLATTEFDKVNESIGDLQLSINRIDLQQHDLVDYMQNEQARREAEAMAQAKAQEHQLKLQAADSAISIISSLAGFIDPQVGNQIATVGQSALQIGESLNGWLGAVAGLNTLDKLTSLSTVVMTGNVLSAVVNIVGLFGGGQPSPDQLILEEIGKLRQQVDQLRTEMHDRFDRVDQELNTIYTTMQDRFDKIDVQLGTITVSLNEIQQSLIAISLDLNRIERNNFEFLDAVGRRPLLDAINGAIGYKQRTSLDMPFQPDFIAYENTFQTWGTVNAFDALSAGPTQRDFSDGQVLAELSAAPLDANLNYLNGWLSAHGLPPFASKRLASPRDWTFASRAYADIGVDWPEHLRRIDPQRQIALDAVGNDLETALQNISTITTASGPQGNTALVSGVMAYYNAKLAALDAGIQPIEAAFVQDVQVNRLERSEPFDLFGGLDQPLVYQAPGLSTIACGAATDTAPAAPTTLKAQTPDSERYNLADYLKLGTMTTCLRTRLTNVQLICQPRHDACDRRGDLEMFINVRFNKVSLAERTLPVGRVIIPGETETDEYVLQRWQTLKAKFEAQSTAVAPTPALAQQRAELLASTTTSMQNQLRDYQQELYGRVLNGLNSGALHPAAVELAGATKLLDSFVILGLPQAIDSDDFLRSLLFSDQQLVNDQQVIAAYATRTLRASAPSVADDDAALMINPRLTLGETGQKRRAALSSLLDRYLDGISAGTYREDSALIANARLDLRLARRFADPDAPDPTPSGQSRGIFLPLIAR